MNYVGMIGSVGTLIMFPAILYKYGVYSGNKYISLLTNNCLVDTGHCAIKFNKFSGVND
jgi:hypothetical protein